MASTATITILATGEKIKVHASKDHPSCSYGQAVWCDDNENPIVQVGLEHLVPEISIEFDEPYKSRRWFGDTIAELRKQQGIAIRDMADRAGVSKATIVNIEHARFAVNIDVATKILTVLGAKLDIKKLENLK